MRFGFKVHTYDRQTAKDVSSWLERTNMHDFKSPEGSQYFQVETGFLTNNDGTYTVIVQGLDPDWNMEQTMDDLHDYFGDKPGLSYIEYRSGRGHWTRY